MNSKKFATILLLCVIEFIDIGVINAYPLTKQMIHGDEDTAVLCTALDVVLVLDASQNTFEEDWNQIISSIINVTTEYSQHIEDIRLSFIRFGSDSVIDFNLGAYSELDNSLYIIGGSQYIGGNPNLAHGLRDASYMIEAQPATRRFAKDVVIVITDGKYTGGDDLDYWLNKLESFNPTIITIPITTDFNISLLNQIASTRSDYSTIDPMHYLEEFADLAFTDCIKEPEEMCAALDVVLVLDASENVLKDHWDEIKKDLIEYAMHGLEYIKDLRLSLVRFSTTSDILFNLGAYSSNYNSFYMINRTEYVGEGSNLAHGLRDAKYIIESQPATRKFAQDVVVVISDGKHNESSDQLEYWSQELKNTNAVIYSIPLTLNFDADVLKAISSSQSNVIDSNDQNLFLYQLLDLAKTDCIEEPEIPSIQCPGNASGTYPYIENCESYVVCENHGTDLAKVTLMSCSNGLLYNYKLRACDWPANVPDCSIAGEHTTAESILSTAVIGDEPVSENLSCPGNIDGYYRDLLDCEYYYVCNGDVVDRIKCPNGLYFDIQTKVCNWPNLVPDCNQILY